MHIRRESFRNAQAAWDAQTPEDYGRSEVDDPLDDEFDFDTDSQEPKQTDGPR